MNDEDWDQIFDMYWETFKATQETAVLSPGGLDPAFRAANVKEFKHRARGDLSTSEIACATIVHVPTGDVVSFISFRLYRGPLGIINSKLANPPAPIQFPQILDSTDREYYEWFYTSKLTAWRAMKDRQVPHIWITWLFTDIRWRRHGAAKILLDWIFEFAAKAKVEKCMVQASGFAIQVGFYEKFGFHVLDQCTFVDEDRFPGRNGITVVTMSKDITTA